METALRRGGMDSQGSPWAGPVQPCRPTGPLERGDSRTRTAARRSTRGAPVSLRVVSAIALLIASCARAGYLHAPTPAAEVSPAACAATAEDPLLACAP